MNAAEAFARIRKGPASMFRTSDIEAAASLVARPASQGSASRQMHTQSQPSAEQVEVTASVVVGQSSYISDCVRAHGKGKGKMSDINHHYCCATGKYPQCEQGTIVTTTTQREPFRLCTPNPLHDLRWWLHDSGSSATNTKHIDKTYLNDERFTVAHLGEALNYAIRELVSLHWQMNGLLEYIERKPYDRQLHDIALEADEDLLRVTPEQVGTMDREKLTQYLLCAAVELDYMKGQCNHIERMVVYAKLDGAKAGDEWELRELKRLGLHDEVDRLVG